MNQDKHPDMPTLEKFPHKLWVSGLLIAALGVIAFSFFIGRGKAVQVEPKEPNTLSLQEQTTPKLQVNKKNKSVPSLQRQPIKKPVTKETPEQRRLALLRQQQALAKQREVLERLRAPTLIVNHVTPIETQDQGQGEKAPSSFDANTRFLQQVNAKSAETVFATAVDNLNLTLTEGTLIHATLETAVNSDLPGSLRAVINRRVFSADGSRQLLSPGDRLVMQYQSGLSQGATRVFAVGSRIIRADGVSIQLGSPVASSLGVAGIGADKINRHFWERFGQASLLAVLATGAANVSVHEQDRYNAADAYRQDLAKSFSQAASDALRGSLPQGPTLHIQPGKTITIFVNKDISFATVYGESSS